MLTYQQWALIADAYIPALALFTLILLWKKITQSGIKEAKASMLSLLLSVALIYLIMMLDNALAIWPIFGLDYSTHTALALVFVVFIARQTATLSLIASLSIAFYAALMIFQNYHTLLDILTTAACVLPLIWWSQNKGLRRLLNGINVD